MKKILVLTIACFSLYAQSQGFGGPVCDQPIDNAGVAEIIIDRCAGARNFSIENIESISKHIRLENDSDGPGYLNIQIHYKKELIGSHVLFAINSRNKCWHEQSLEVSCPNL